MKMLLLIAFGTKITPLFHWDCIIFLACEILALLEAKSHVDSQLWLR